MRLFLVAALSGLFTSAVHAVSQTSAQSFPTSVARSKYASAGSASDATKNSTGSPSAHPGVLSTSTAVNPFRPKLAPIPEGVDTVLNSTGVASTTEILAAKLADYCSTELEVCKALQNHVVKCADMHGACSLDDAHSVLNKLLETNMCGGSSTVLVNTICSRIWTEASRCKNKKVRSCSYHHINYILTQARDLFALPANNTLVLLTTRNIGTEEGGISKSVVMDDNEDDYLVRRGPDSSY